jgi:hypothetical protein
MNFFLIERVIDAIKSGKPVMYYNIETTGEDVKKRVLDALHEDEKRGYKIKNEPNPNKEI